MDEKPLLDESKIRLLNQLAVEIRQQRDVGNMKQAGHFAGVMRNVIDPKAPIPAAPGDPKLENDT